MRNSFIKTVLHSLFNNYFTSQLEKKSSKAQVTEELAMLSLCLSLQVVSGGDLLCWCECEGTLHTTKRGSQRAGNSLATSSPCPCHFLDLRCWYQHTLDQCHIINGRPSLTTSLAFFIKFGELSFLSVNL